jgi:hypothetical protein
MTGQEEEQEQEQEVVVKVVPGEHKTSPGMRRCRFRTKEEDAGIPKPSQNPSTPLITSPPRRRGWCRLFPPFRPLHLLLLPLQELYRALLQSPGLPHRLRQRQQR